MTRIINSQIKDPEKKAIVEAILTPDVESSQQGKIRTFATRVFGDKKRKEFEMTEENFNQVVDFIFDFPQDNLEDDVIDEINQLMLDIDFVGRTVDDTMNLAEITKVELFAESALRTRRSSASEKRYARLYYKRRGKKALKKRVRTSKHKQMVRKRERLNQRGAKTTPSGRRKIRYNTKGHVNNDIEILKNDLQILLLESKED